MYSSAYALNDLNRSHANLFTFLSNAVKGMQARQLSSNRNTIDRTQAACEIYSFYCTLLARYHKVGELKRTINWSKVLLRKRQEQKLNKNHLGAAIDVRCAHARPARALARWSNALRCLRRQTSVMRCTLSVPGRLKAAPQRSQTKGRSPVWTSMCRSLALRWVYNLPQSEQGNFCLVCLATTGFPDNGKTSDGVMTRTCCAARFVAITVGAGDTGGVSAPVYTEGINPRPERL